MHLLVLAGGFGSRLKSVISEVPKAIAPVTNHTFLYYQIENWLSQGIKSFVFLLCYQSDLIIEFLVKEKNGLLNGCKVEWSIEPKPMGTGGSVAYAVEQFNLKDDFLLTNADTWIGNGIKQILCKASPAMAVVSVADAARYGCVQLDEQNIVQAFYEKANNNAPGFVNAGLCLLHPDLFNKWNHKPFSLEQTLFPFWANRGILNAVILNTDFIDIGVPDDYFRFCRWIESNKMIKL